MRKNYFEQWRYHLGYFGYQKIQQLIKSGVLSHSQATCSLHTAVSKIQNPPKCAACQYGKQCHCLSPGKTSSLVRDRTGALKQDNLFAGQKIAVDHFVCSTRGRLLTSKGKTGENEMFSSNLYTIYARKSPNHIIKRSSGHFHPTKYIRDCILLVSPNHQM
jgi:hypothetical protein